VHWIRADYGETLPGRSGQQNSPKRGIGDNRLDIQANLYDPDGTRVELMTKLRASIRALMFCGSSAVTYSPSYAKNIWQGEPFPLAFTE
jgi:hypothetical protein